MRVHAPFTTLATLILLLGTLLASCTMPGRPGETDPMAPEGQVGQIDVSGPLPGADPRSLGNPNAPITMIEYGSFQCPSCAQFARRTLPPLTQHFIATGKVYLIYRDYTLKYRPGAPLAARAGLCAADQGKFWPMHDRLFLGEEQSEWGRGEAEDRAVFIGYARELELDLNPFVSCLDSPETTARVTAGNTEAERLGALGTPSFLVNGKLFFGRQRYRTWHEVFEQELAELAQAGGQPSPTAKAQSLADQGKAYFASGRHQLAKAAFDKAIEEQPERVELYVERGRAHAEQEDLEEAIADYTTAIRLAPKLVEPYYRRGLAYSATGEHKLALKDFDQVSILDPRHAKAYLERGRIFLEQEDLAKAIDELTGAIALDGRSDEAYLERGRTYVLMATEDERFYTSAIADLDQALALDPNESDAYFERALLRYELGDYKNTVTDYDEIIRIEPDRIDAFYNRGLAYTELRLYDSALVDYNHVFELKPSEDVEDVYCSRALVYHRLGDLPQALADYNRAVELEPNDGYAYYGRARLYLDLDLDDEAIQDFKKVVALDEENYPLPAGMVEQARETLRELGG